MSAQQWNRDCVLSAAYYLLQTNSHESASPEQETHGTLAISSVPGDVPWGWVQWNMGAGSHVRLSTHWWIHPQLSAAGLWGAFTNLGLSLQSPLSGADWSRLLSGFLTTEKHTPLFIWIFKFTKVGLQWLSLTVTLTKSRITWETGPDCMPGSSCLD